MPHSPAHTDHDSPASDTSANRTAHQNAADKTQSHNNHTMSEITVRYRNACSPFETALHRHQQAQTRFYERRGWSHPKPSTRTRHCPAAGAPPRSQRHARPRHDRPPEPSTRRQGARRRARCRPRDQPRRRHLEMRSHQHRARARARTHRRRRAGRPASLSTARQATSDIGTSPGLTAGPADVHGEQHDAEPAPRDDPGRLHPQSHQDQRAQGSRRPNA
jgi:hypothetical protein